MVSSTMRRPAAVSAISLPQRRGPDGYVWEIMWMDPAALAGTPGAA